MSSTCQYDEDEHFECADAGAADTFPCAAGDLKRGDTVCIRGRPCKVLAVSCFKGGKHGHCKAAIEGEDIFTGRKHELVAPASYPMPCPFVFKSEYQLIDIAADGRQLSLLDADCEQRGDLDLPLDGSFNEATGRAIRAHFAAGKSLVLLAQRAMGIEAVMSFKVDNGR